MVHCLDPCLGHAIRRQVGGDAISTCDLEGLLDPIADLADIGHRALALEASLAKPVGVENRATGVGDVIDRVDDAPPVEQGSVARLVFEYIVRRSGDDPGLEPGNGAFVDDAAKRVRREDVDVLVVDAVRRDGAHAHFRDRSRYLFIVGVTDDDLGAFLNQQGQGMPANSAEALQGHAAPAQLGRAPRALGARAHGLDRAECCRRRDLADPAAVLRQRHHVVGLGIDEFHVLEGCPDILAGQELAAELVYHPAERAEERLGLVSPGIADNYGLAAAEVDAGGGVLIGHAACQP